MNMNEWKIKYDLLLKQMGKKNTSYKHLRVRERHGEEEENNNRPDFYLSNTENEINNKKKIKIII